MPPPDDSGYDFEAHNDPLYGPCSRLTSGHTILGGEEMLYTALVNADAPNIDAMVLHAPAQALPPSLWEQTTGPPVRAGPSPLPAPESEWRAALRTRQVLRSLDGTDLHAVTAVTLDGVYGHVLIMVSDHARDFWLRDTAVAEVMRVFKSEAYAAPRSVSTWVHEDDRVTRDLLIENGFHRVSYGVPLYNPVQQWKYTHTASGQGATAR
ncbi:hypothetical protein Q5752_006770 [Cryptotrichosporon argae]